MKGGALLWVVRRSLVLLTLFRWPASISASFCHTSTTTTGRISAGTIAITTSSTRTCRKNRCSLGIRSSARMSAAKSLNDETVDTDEIKNSNDCHVDNKPIITMGLLADIQYAPIDDGHSYSGTPRYYRNALEVTRHAAQHFQDEQVDLCVHLGDLCDGKCEQNMQAVDDVLEALAVYQNGPVLHIYGNHCLYNMDRPTLQSKLGIPFVQEPCGDWVGYYSRVLTKDQKWLGIVLDSYDVALLQRCIQNSRKRQQAVELLQRHNSANYEKGQENSPQGLEGVQRRFVAFNGAIGEIQLQWLQEELQTARQNQQRVLIFSHQPILPDSTDSVCLMWNYEDVLHILRSYKDVVAASFSGHAHEGGYQRDPESGIHFRVLEAVLENPHPHRTYAMVDFYPDRLHVRGFGNCESAVYSLDHLQQEPQSRTTSKLESSTRIADGTEETKLEP